MNWDAVSAISEIIGALAVIVSLIYVGIQIKANSRAVRSATANETTAAISAWYSATGSCQQASRLFYIGLTRPEELEKEDLAQFFYLGMGYCWNIRLLTTYRRKEHSIWRFKNR